MLKRREILGSVSAGITGAALAACGGSQADTTPAPAKRPFVLVHGAWHGAWCFERLSALLAAAGHPVVARDLPGHGLNAQLPASYAVHPRGAAFSTEPSPVAGLTLADYTNQIVGIINGLLAAGQPAPVLVGHSMAGLVIQSVAEALGPTKIHHLVYMTAFMPRNNSTGLDYIGAPTQADSKLPPLALADPTVVGAIRVDPQSDTPSYIQSLQDGFYADVDAVTQRAAVNLLTPDEPAAPFAAPVRVTAGSWGAVPRTFLRCANDQAIRPATQDLMVSEADAFTPNNKTRVVRLGSSHSPFFSQPQTVANALLALTSA